MSDKPASKQTTICPKCVFLQEARYEEESIVLSKLYGKIPEQEYNQKLSEINTRRDNPLESTLEEYYSIHMYNEGLFVDYSCGCKKCGFFYDYSNMNEIDFEKWSKDE